MVGDINNSAQYSPEEGTANTTLVGAALAASAIPSTRYRLAIATNQSKILEENLVYFWSPKALYFSSSGVSKFRYGEHQDYRYDHAIFSLFAASGMLIQEDFALQFVIGDGLTTSTGLTFDIGTA